MHKITDNKLKMGNVVTVSLYPESELEKRILFEEFAKSNLQFDIQQLDLINPDPSKLTLDILEIDPINSHIIDFKNHNHATLSTHHFSQIMKFTLNELSKKNQRAEFKFIFLFPFSKINEGFAMINSLFDSMNSKISNSLYLLVVNDTLTTSQPFSDKVVYKKTLENFEVKSLIEISEKDNLVLSWPRLPFHKNNFFRAIRLSLGSNINSYDIDKINHQNTGRTIVFGEHIIEVNYSKTALLENPKMEQEDRRNSLIVVRNFTEDYQSIPGRQDSNNSAWIIAGILIVLLIIGIICHGSYDD